MSCAALIVAAGQGRRFGGSEPKQFVPLAGRPLLAWTLDAFARCPAIDQIVLVVAAAEEERARAVVTEHLGDRPVTICAGGAERSDSVRAGLNVIGDGASWVAIHDGARPLATPELIAKVVEAAAETGAALPALPMRDTVKRADGARVAQTIDRAPLRLAQTPQVFSRELLARAYAAHDGSPVTDDAQLVEAIGAPIALVPGEPNNIKITVPDDLSQADSIVRRRLPGRQRWPRCGVGYDVHQLAPGDHVIIGGVKIPFEQRLVGHSDADVLAHAAGDALLGAAALGDLGKHFPPSDPSFAGANSIELLGRIADLVASTGYTLGNLDCVVVCERPKLAPHIEQMRAHLARAVGASLEQVSVKATTTETLGFTGRREGIAAYATAMIVPK